MVGSSEITELFCKTFRFDYNFICHGFLFLKVHKTVFDGRFNNLYDDIPMSQTDKSIAKRINCKYRGVNGGMVVLAESESCLYSIDTAKVSELASYRNGETTASAYMP